MYDILLFVGFKVFDKLKNNSLIHGDGREENVHLLRHPRAAHNLLDYTPDNQSFKARTSTEL